MKMMRFATWHLSLFEYLSRFTAKVWIILEGEGFCCF